MVGRHLVRNARVADLALGSEQPLAEGRLGDEQRVGDFRGRQPAEGAQGQRHLSLERQRRMAAGEDEAESIVDQSAGRLIVHVAVLR